MVNRSVGGSCEALSGGKFNGRGFGGHADVHIISSPSSGARTLGRVHAMQIGIAPRGCMPDGDHSPLGGGTRPVVVNAGSTLVDVLAAWP